MMYVVYHADCVDGFAAAWVTYGVVGELATYVPARYGDDPPPAQYGDRLLILDFSYSKETMDRLHQELGEGLLLLDHHQSAQERLGMAVPYGTIDLEHCGAMLTWHHWHGDAEPPELLRYVEDRDLWRWELPLSREVSAALELFPRDLHLWSHGLFMENLRQDGVPIRRAQRAQVERLIQEPLWISDGQEVFPAVNSAVLQSEIGEQLLTRYPEAALAGIFSIRPRHARWSLRSRERDVARMAARWGGGGHQRAAGFTHDPWLPAEWGEVTWKGEWIWSS